jgi:hypothetical protein
MIGVDGVEGLMKSLNLSKMEKKGVKLGWASGDQVGLIEPKAMEKFLSEKPTFVNGIANALEKIWCPL